MRWSGRKAAVLWPVFAAVSCVFLWSIWFVETPPWGMRMLLPLAHEKYCNPIVPYRQNDDYLWGDLYDKVTFYLDNETHLESLEKAAEVEEVVLGNPQADLFNTVQPVDHIVVDGEIIGRNDWDDPGKGPLLARVLQDATRIEWRMLWERALIGTAIWIAALVAMLGLTHWSKRRAAQPCQTAEQG